MRFQMLLLATAAGTTLSGQTPRAPTPTRDPLTPGYVRATELPDGAVPSPDVDGNFVIGPTHAPAAEIVARTDAPHGTVYTSTMASAESKIYPGIARDSGTYPQPDPESPAKPLRVWLSAGHQDLLTARDGMHDWVLASENVAKVVAAKGYHY